MRSKKSIANTAQTSAHRTIPAHIFGPASLPTVTIFLERGKGAGDGARGLRFRV